MGRIGVVGVLAVLSLGSTGSGRAAFPGQNGRIAFVRGASQLVSLDPKGVSTRLHVNSLAVAVPRWSANGRRLLFAGARAGQQPPVWRIYVVNADGSGLRALTTPPDGAVDLDPSWSPDGKQIVFDRRRPSPIVGTRRVPQPISSRLYVMRSDGSQVGLLARDARTPAWSPDGRTIAFVVARVAGPASLSWLAVVKADGTGRRRLTRSGSGEEDSPNWSPDSRRITFVDGGRILTVDRGGTDIVQLTDGVTYDGTPAYSPDGRRIVFVRGTKGILYVMASDGAGQQAFLGRALEALEPDWQPLPAP